MDANSFTFASFTNQASAYCTPGTGGMGTYYHNKAGDLHTPNLGFNLGTPLSLPHSDNRHDSTTAFGMQHFQPNFLESAAFQTPNFGSQQAFAPSTFLHQDSAFGTMHSSNDNSPGQQNVVGHIMGPQKTRATLPPETCDPSAPDSKFPRSDKSVPPRPSPVLSNVRALDSDIEYLSMRPPPWSSMQTRFPSRT